MSLNGIPPYALAWLTGFGSGFFAAVPVGPINVTILHDGARRGFKWGLLIGLGAVTMESIYCSISFAGFSELFESKLMQAIMELASFVLVTILGVKYTLASALPSTPKSVEQIEDRIHPHTAFMTGFVRVLGNPAVLLFWITMTASFLSHELVAPTWRSKIACIAGVAMGAMSWFVLLSFTVSLGHRKYSDRALLRLSRICGLFLLGFAVIIGCRLVLLLLRAHNKA